MGLDDSQLTVPDALRCWHAAGWRFFFQEPRAMSQPVVADDPASWPSPWCGYAAKITPGASVFVTYEDLAADMAGHGDAARRSFWRACIAALQCAKGTVAFWPMTDCIESRLVANPDMFHRAMDVYRPKIAACFGEAAFLALAGDAREGDNVVVRGATTYLAFPSPEQIMAEGDQGLRDIAHTLRFHLTRR